MRSMAVRGIFVGLALLVASVPVLGQDPSKPEVLALAHPRTPAQAAARLSGTWKLNTELSPQIQTGGSPAPAGQSAVGRGPGGRPQAYEAQRLVEERNIRLRALYRELLEAPAALTLTVTLTSAKFVDANETARSVNINQKKEKLDLGTAIVDSRTRWDGTALTIELDGGGPDLRLVETFELSPTGAQMLVTIRAGDVTDPNTRGLVGRVHRVYDRVNAGSR